MKKWILVIICTLLLVGCGGKSENSNSNSNQNTNTDTNNNTNTNTDTNTSSNSNITNTNSNENEDPNVGKYTVEFYIFHSSTCSVCQSEIAWLKSIEGDYPYLNIHYYEVSDSKNAELANKVKDALGVSEEDYNYVPFTVMGNDYFIGWDTSRERKFIRMIKENSTIKLCDVVKTIQNGGNVAACMKQNEEA